MYFEHNIEIYERFEPVILEHHECCLVATMGTGKTDICIEFIKRYNLNTLVILPTVDLCNQWKDIAEKNDICTLSTVTYHTFSKAFAVLSVGFDCYIFDEAHHMDSAIWGKAIRKFKEMIDEDKYIIGLTGDPVRYFDSCKNVVDTMFHGHVAYGLTQYEAIMNGILPNVIYVCAIYDTKGLYDKYKGMATTKHLQGKLNLAYENCKKINDILISHAMDHMKGFVFVDKIESIGGGVDLISKAFPDISVYSAHSKMTKNEKSNNINGFKSSDTGFMVSVNMFNEGYHVSGTNTVIMLRKTGSPTIYAQQIGRALSANHNSTAIIYDFVSNNESIKSINKRISTITTILGEGLNKDKSKRNDIVSNQVIIHDYSRDFLEVIEGIELANSRDWTTDEDNIIRQYYLIEGKNVFKRLNNRTPGACANRANYLGVSKYSKQIWTTEEDGILREFYPNVRVCVQKLPNRSESACRARAVYLGIAECCKYSEWTQEEDNILRDYYPTMGKNVNQLLSNRSEASCLYRANKLNITYYGKWTPEEDAILREFYPIMGGNVYTKFNSKSKEECYSRAHKLGIKYYMKEWTPEEDSILREYYPTMGGNVYTKFHDRSESACKNRVQALGITTDRRCMWSKKEDDIIKEFYPTMGGDVVKLLHGKTKDKCRERARRLGVKYSKMGDKWTPEEDAILREFYPLIGMGVYKKLPGRTSYGCRSRAIKLKICNNDKIKGE